MNGFFYLALHDVAAISAGAYLVSHEHPWWGALCFLLAACTTVREKQGAAE